MGPLNGFVHMESTSSHQTKASGDKHGKSKKSNGEEGVGASFASIFQSIVVPNRGHTNAHVPVASDAGAIKGNRKLSSGRSNRPELSSGESTQYGPLQINSLTTSGLNGREPSTGPSEAMPLESSRRQSPQGENLKPSHRGKQAGKIGTRNTLQLSINRHQLLLSKHLAVSPEAGVRSGSISAGTSKGSKANTEEYVQQIQQALVKATQNPRGKSHVSSETSGRVSRDAQQQKAGSKTLASLSVADVTSLAGESKVKPSEMTVHNLSSATSKSSGGSPVSKGPSQVDPQLPGLAGLNISTLTTPSPSSDATSAQTLSLADPSAHSVFQDIVSGQVQSGQQSVTVNIHPEGMGNINIIVNQTTAHQISVQVQASSAQTVQWFNQQKDGLTSALQNTGFQLSGFQISYGQGNADQHGRGFIPYRGIQTAKSAGSLASIDVVQPEEVGISDSQTRRWFG